ncbi:terminase large subunit, partial [bacterium]|nr:terminase large subunit [bacterium]
MSSYSQRILDYCHAAINDTILHRKTCLYEKLACQRHLNDLAKQSDPEYPYYFDEDAVDHRCYFTECLQHTKGKWRGKLIELEPEQLFAEGVKFGWLKKKNGKRRFSKSYEAVPRKNGKSIRTATTGLYLAFADDEPAAEVYAGATTEKQAMMIFTPAFMMVKMNEEFIDYYGVKLTGTSKNPTSIYNEEDMSMICPIVGNPGDGQSPHGGLIDEYHEHPTSVLYDAMDTGMGAREQPLLAVITTAGENTSYPCYDLHLEAIQVLEGTIENDRLFCTIFTIDKDDDWQDFECWKKANPNYGISIEEDYLWGKYQDALNKPTQRNILLTKHLNLWQNAGVGFMDMLRWQK